MTKITKIIIGIIIIVAVVWLGYFAIKGSSKPISKELIKIGTILPLTGDFAALGNEVRRGIEIAAEEAKTEGINLEVLYEDDQSLSPTVAVNAANKLVNIDKVNVGITMLVEESMPIAPIFNNNKTPLLVLWDSNRFIKEAGEYIFSNGFSTELAGELMANYAFNDLGFKNIAIIRHIDPWAEIISESFKNKFESLGGKVVYNEKLTPDVTDYRTAIIKLKQTDPDGVYFPLLPMNSVRFIIQANQLIPNMPLLTGDALIQDVISTAGKAAENIYFTNIFTDQNQASSLLTNKYKIKYNSDPMDINLVSFGYDGVKEIVRAIEAPRKSLRDAMIEIFGQNRSADRLEKIYKVINGTPAVIK